MSWLDKIAPSTEAYAYHGQLLCRDCAAKISSQLPPSNVFDNGDSDTFPQPVNEPGGGESDDTNFCGCGSVCKNAVSIANHKIGAPLGNQLTQYGWESLGESIHRLMLSPRKYDRLLSRLLRHVWNSYLPVIGAPVRAKPLWMKNRFPTSLDRALRSYEKSRGRTPLPVTICCDVDCAYLIYPNDYQIDFLQIALSDEGEYQGARLVSIPLGAQKDDVLLDLADLISEGAWD